MKALGLFCCIAVGFAAAGCASSSVRPDAELAEARAAAEAGEPGANLRVARVVARYGPRAAPYLDGVAAARRAPAPEGRFWEAVFLDALGRDADAVAAWLALLSAPDAPPTLVSAAAVAVAGLVDRVPLGPTPASPDAVDPSEALRRAMQRPGVPGALAAEALEAVAARIAADAPARADALTAAARARLGVVTRYRLIGPRDDRPALARPAPLRDGAPLAGATEPPGGEASAAGWPDWTDSSGAGGVGVPPTAHGVFSAIVDAPREGQLEVEVVGEVASRVFADGRLVAEHRWLTAPLGRRLRALVDAPASGLLEVQLAARGFPRPVRIMIRPASPAHTRADDAGPLAERLATLMIAIADRDPQAIADTLAERAGGPAFDPTIPLDALWLARAALADPDRPGATARSQASGSLLGALALAPELGGVRAELSELLLEENDNARATAVAAAGPLGDHALRLEAQLALAAGLSAREPAEALRTRLPRSCEAAGRWLDAGWEALKLRGGPADTPPRCFELELRYAVLLHAAWQLPRARALLDDLAARAAPGAQLGRVLLARSRLGLAAGELDAAAADARAALAAGAEAEQALELLLTVALLKGDAGMVQRTKDALEETPGVSALSRRDVLDATRDLGLPLADGLTLARGAAAPDDDPDSASGSYEVLLADRHTRIYADGAMLHRDHRVVRLLEANAVDEFGEIALPDEAEVLLARTWKPIDGGGWQPIEPEDLIEKTSISLPALERGAIAEVAWFWYEPPAARFAPGWRTPVFRFASDRGRTRVARWVVDAPPDLPLDVVTVAGGPAPTRPAPGRLVFEARAMPRVLTEPLDPRPDRRIPGAMVANRFDPTQIVDRLADEAASTLAPSPSLSALVAEALGGLNAGRGLARLEALHAFVVSQIRDLDESPLSGRAAFAASRRAGERASLLAALCRAAGVEADLALVRPLAYGALDPEQFEPENYLYPVVRARVDGREVWLDTVNRFAPFDYLPPLVQGSDALVLTPDGGQRVTTPSTPAREGEREISMVVSVAPGGLTYAARGDERITGVYAMSWRQALLDMPQDRREAVLATIVQQSLPGAQVEHVTTIALERRGEPLVVRWEARGLLAEQAPGQTALTVGLAPERLEQGTVLVPDRRTPMLVNRSVRLSLRVSVRAPEDLLVAGAPEPVRVTHPLMTMERATERTDDGHGLIVTKTFRLAAGIVGPDAYAAWKTAVRAVDRADVVHLVLDVVPNERMGGAGPPTERGDGVPGAVTTR